MIHALSVKNLNFRYGSVEVLSGITFDVEKGGYIGLAGPNGAGKTTLIKIMLGLADGYDGSVELFGTPIKNFRDWGRIGYLPQKVEFLNPLFPATVKEAAGLGLLARKSFPKKFTEADAKRVDETLELMGIADIGDKLIGELSRGQQQRALLARALVHGPELLILDEPSTALDPQTRESFYEFIKKLNREKGITVILITHDTAQIGQYADKLLYLDKKIVFFGHFSEFCKSEEMSRYFGNFAQHLICHQH